MKACKGIDVGGRKSKIPLKRQSQQALGLMEGEAAIAGSILLETPPRTPAKTAVVTVEAHAIAKHCQSGFMHPLPKPHQGHLPKNNINEAACVLVSLCFYILQTRRTNILNWAL